MKIAVITRMLRKDKIEGIGMFAKEILSRIVRNHPEHEFTFLFDRKYDEEFVFAKNVTPFILAFPARHPVQMAYWHQVALKNYLKKNKHDILISPDGSIPLNAEVPTIAVIHDLNFEYFPEDLPFSFRLYYTYYYPRIAKVASRIVTVSEFSKSDLLKFYNVDGSKVDVAYNAVGDEFKKLEEVKIKEVRNKYSSGLPYFFFIGSLHKRKNIDGMIKAYDHFRSSSSSPVKFIFAGAKRWWTKEMEEAFSSSPYKNDIHFIGRVTDTQLVELIGGAYALMYPSKFEGFGIPIVEAMKCGVPVITSNETAMPEIAGDAAMLVNPHSVESMSDAMIKLVSDEGLRQTLIAKGFEQSKKFSWDQSADKMWKSIERTVKK